MKKTRNEIVAEIEKVMIESYGKVYKFRMFEEYKGQRLITFTKGEMRIEVEYTKAEMRNKTLELLGI